METPNEEMRHVLVFLRPMIPTLRAADRTDALMRRKIGTAFSIAKYAVTDEPSLNQIFADLLNPRGPHGQGGAFLRLFIEMLSGDLTVDREEEWFAVPNHPTVKARYVDVALFHSNDAAIYVECKPWAAEGHEQLSDYAKDLLARSERQKMLVFVPGHQDREPVSLSPELTAQLGESGYVKIAYERKRASSSMVHWLEQCAAVSEADNVRMFIADLKHYLDGEFPGDEGSVPMNSDPFVDMVIDSVRKDEDLVKTVLRVERVARRLKTDIVNQFLAKLKEELENKMGSEWVVERDEFNLDTRNRLLRLKKKNWPDHWGVAIQNLGLGLNDFIIGFRCPNSASGIKDSRLGSENERGKIRKAVEDNLRAIRGVNAKTDWYAAYTWLPEPFRHWDTKQTLLLLSGFERLDGSLAVGRFAQWFQTLAQAAGSVVDAII
jgi:PD-(D/E)XK nuclease superfamily